MSRTEATDRLGAMFAAWDEARACFAAARALDAAPADVPTAAATSAALAARADKAERRRGELLAEIIAAMCGKGGE